MRERSIIFNSELIKAILDSRKTMTRRLIKLRNPINTHSSLSVQGRIYSMSDMQREIELTKNIKPSYPCPYGQTGDMLWVRETFVIEDDYEYIDGSYTPITDRPIKTLTDIEGYEYHLIPHYRATEPEPNIVPYGLDDPTDDRTRWQPSIHMPRWASRITLEITGVRVERLQEITEENCFAEGVENICVNDPIAAATWSPISDFVYLWDSLYTKKSEYQWVANPWVWVIEFRDITVTSF